MPFLRSILRSGLLALAIAAFPPIATAQVASHYRGTIVNDARPGSPSDLELFIYLRSDTSWGWMKAPQQLGETGRTAILERDIDSLYLVTRTAAGDTVLWVSPHDSGTLEGRYWIKGPRLGGQAGRWRLEPQPRFSKATLELFAACAGGLVVLAIAALSASGRKAWWRWRAANARAAKSDERAELGGIDGWLAWFVFSHVLVIGYEALGLKRATASLDTSWMLGSALGMQPFMFLEVAIRFFQIFAIVLGIVLILRRSPVTPMYWVSMLSVGAAYAAIDIAAMASAAHPMMAAFSADAAEGMRRSVARETTLNEMAMMSSLIWSLYWIRSRRVLVVFGPPSRFRNSPSAKSSRTGSVAGSLTPPTEATAVAQA